MTDKDKDPWGRKSGQQPPDLIDLFKKLFNKNKPKQSFTFNSKWLLIVPLGLVFIWGLSGFFIVQAQDKAVITRFKAYRLSNGILGPGLHWIPRFIDKAHILNVQKNYVISIKAPQMLAVDRPKPGVNNNSSSHNPAVNKTTDKIDSADANDSGLSLGIVVASVKVNYRIKDPYKYLYNTTNPEEILTSATNSALRQVVSSMDVNDVISTSRNELHTRLLHVLNEEIMNKYDSGLEVRDVVLGSATVPDPVKDAYIAVAKARAEKISYMNQANKYKAEKSAIVTGIEACMSNKADTYAAQVKNKAKGDVARFNVLAAAYDAAPDVTRERLYLEYMQEVLSHTTNVVMDSTNKNMVYLPLDRLTKEPTTGEHGENAQAAYNNSDAYSSTVGDVNSDLIYCQQSVAANLDVDLNSTNAVAHSSSKSYSGNSSAGSVNSSSGRVNNGTGGVKYGS